MSLFTIYTKPEITDGQQLREPENVIVIRDRFSIFACLLTPVWCIWHRLWLELLAYFGYASIFGFVALIVGESAFGWIGLLIAMLIGLEASSIRGYALTRKGYGFEGDLVASNSREAEYRYLAGQIEKYSRHPLVRSTEPGPVTTRLPNVEFKPEPAS